MFSKPPAAAPPSKLPAAGKAARAAIPKPGFAIAIPVPITVPTSLPSPVFFSFYLKLQ